MIRIYHFVMNYLKIEYTARKVKSIDFYNVNENILFETFPSTAISGKTYPTVRVIWCS